MCIAAAAGPRVIARPASHSEKTRRRLRAALGQRAFDQLDERLLPGVTARRKRLIVAAVGHNRAKPTAPHLHTLPGRGVFLSD
jgi:hypothetical protein